VNVRIALRWSAASYMNLQGYKPCRAINIEPLCGHSSDMNAAAG